MRFITMSHNIQAIWKKLCTVAPQNNANALLFKNCADIFDKRHNKDLGMYLNYLRVCENLTV